MSNNTVISNEVKVYFKVAFHYRRRSKVSNGGTLPLFNVFINFWSFTDYNAKGLRCR